METPRIIKDTENAYVATKAALEAALKADPPIENLGFPGMGTGIGKMDFDDCARQMCRAFVEVMSPVKVED